MRSTWNWIESKFFFNAFRQNVLVLTSGNLIVQAISLLSYPILSRLYPPDVFGEYALFNSIILLISFAITLRYEVAIPLPKKDEEALILRKASLRIAVVLAFLLLGIAIVLEWLQITPLTGYLYLIPIVALASSLLQIERFWALRVSQLPRYFKMFISYRTSYLLLALAIPFLLLEPQFNALIWSLSGASIIILIYLFFTNVGSFKRLDRGLAKSILKQHHRFPRYGLPGFLIGHITNQLPILLLVKFFDNDTTGQYAVAMNMLFLPQNMLMVRLSEALYQGFNQYSRAALKQLVFKIWRFIALLLILPCVILFLYGSDLLVFVLGPKWQLAGQIAEVLSILIFFGSFNAAVSSLFGALHLQKLTLLKSTIQFIYIGIAFVTAGVLQDIILGVWIMVGMGTINHLAFVLVLLKKLEGREENSLPSD